MIRDIDSLIKKSNKLLPSEDLFFDAMHDFMKDEIKLYMREKLNENPEIRERIREAMIEYVEAKVKESEAMAKLVKAYAELGIITLPPELREEIIKSMYGTFQEEIDEIIEKTL